MTLDGFLSFIALVVAVYTVVPRHRQLEFVYRLRWFDFAAATSAFFAILYLHYYKFFRHFHLTPSFGMSKLGLPPDKSSFLICAIVGVYLLILLRLRGVNRDTIRKFKTLCEELSNQLLYAELVSILDRRMADIYRIYCDNVVLKRIQIRILEFTSKYTVSGLDAGALLAILAEEERSGVARVKPPESCFSKLRTKFFSIIASGAKAIPMKHDGQQTAVDGGTGLKEDDFHRNTVDGDRRWTPELMGHLVRL